MNDQLRPVQAPLQGTLTRRDMITKTLALGTSFVGAGALLQACGTTSPSAASPGPVTLNVLKWGGDGGFTQARDKLASLYPADLSRIKLKVRVAGQDDIATASSFRLALSSGTEVPDIVMLNRTELAEFADAGVLLALDDAFKNAKSDLYAGAVSVVSRNGKIYGFPGEVKSKMFFYRYDMFDQAGIQLTDLDTVDGFIDAGKKFHAKFPQSYILNLGLQPQHYLLGEIFSSYSDLAIADSSGKFQITTHPAFADAFTFLKRIHDSGIALPVDDFASDWAQAFSKQAVGGVLIANWMKFFLPGYAPKQQGLWKVAPSWPKLAPMADQSYGSEAGGSLFVVPTKAPHSQEAITYLSHWFLDAKGALAIYEQGLFTPLLKSAKNDVENFIKNGHKPATVTDAQWQSQPQNFFGSDYQNIEFQSYDRVKAFNYDPAATKEFDILNLWLQKHLSGQATLNQALQGAQSDMQAQIGNPFQG